MTRVKINASPPHLHKYDDVLSWKLVRPQKHVLVAGKTEPSQVFERGLVPFNQLLRREFNQQQQQLKTGGFASKISQYKKVS